jgi:transposase
VRVRLRQPPPQRDLLKEQLRRFKRQLFDAKSEAGAAQQKDMFFNEAEAEGAQAQPAAEETDDDKIDVPAHRRAKRGRKPLEPALPREVIRHELPEAERMCPHDGAALREIGVEVSEQLDIVPQQVRVIRHERVKYACPCCDGGLRLASKPPQVIPKGLLSEAALAWVVTSKYLDGLPLYRQAALLGRFGGTQLSRNTLAARDQSEGNVRLPSVSEPSWAIRSPGDCQARAARNGTTESPAASTSTRSAKNCNALFVSPASSMWL